MDSAGALLLRSKEVSIFEIDVTSYERVLAVSEDIKRMTLENGYELYAVINNAGIMVMGEFEWLTIDMIKNQLMVNLFGPIMLLKIFLPLIREHKSRVINVGSHCGSIPLPGISVYSASKAGLKSFTKACRQELEKFGIPVIEFVPGSYIMQSCIMSQQKNFSETMQGELSEEVLRVYGDYFNRYNQYLASVPTPVKGTEPVRINDSKLYERLESALFSPTPKRLYVNQPRRYFLYFSLFSLLPDCSVRDYLIKKFIKMPEWSDAYSSS